MSFKEQEKKYRALNDWFNTPQGARVARAFTAELKASQEQLSGRRLLQLGSCGNNLWLPELKYYQKLIASPYDSANVSFVTLLNQLPIERNSVDCVIAPLILEAFTHDKNPLDEIDRILKPMGYAIFWGVNPWSFWGLALKLKHISCFAKTSVTLNSVFSLKHAMFQRGYRQCALNTFFYIPPVTNEKLIHRLEFLNEMGKMLSPFPAGFYCFIAQKHQNCYIPPRVNPVYQDLKLARV